MSIKKLAVVATAIVLVAAFFMFEGQQYLSLAYLQQHFEQHPWQSAFIYFIAYWFMTALSLPGATAITLLGGAVFGLWAGVLLVSFASTLGATCAFLLSRFLFADHVKRRFGHYLDDINQGVEKDGIFYLLSLRLIPAVPFFVINLVFGLTNMKTLTFYWVSQLGMLVGTVLYVNAGAEIGNIDTLSASSILTPSILGALVALGLFPLLLRLIVRRYQVWKLYRPYQKPDQFDANVIVIGAGSAGLVSAYIASAVKAKVILIEKHQMGGDCLNTGCVPSKTLIQAARARHQITHANRLGLNANATVNLKKVFQRVQQVIERIAVHDSIERYESLGVECIQGEAKILSPYEVSVNGKTLTTAHIIIATGARPFIPTIEGLQACQPLSSDTLWSLESPPKRLAIIGTGPIGCELAQAFQRLGVEVTLIGQTTRLMPKEDADVSEHILEVFQQEGVRVLLNQQVIRCEKTTQGARIYTRNGAGEQHIDCERILVATGRQANTDNLGLSTLGIETQTQGTIKVDDYLRTTFPNIYACGDVAGPYQFTHTAAHQAWYACVNALFGQFKSFKVDYRVIPWATFTDPEVARVGINEQEAKEKGLDYEVTRYELDDLDRAITDDVATGFVKVITPKGSDRILGCTIVGAHSGELITEFVTAMKYKLGLNKILGTIHIYPTMSEAGKFAAGVWRKNHVSPTTLSLLARFHRWRRRP